MKLIDPSTNDEIKLPDDMYWIDEFKWQPRVSNSTYSLSGALIVEEGVRLAGRPITLQPPEDLAWIPRAIVSKLRTWASYPSRRFILQFEYPTDTRQFVVIFAPDGEPVESDPVKGFPQHRDDDWFKIKLKFVEVV